MRMDVVEGPVYKPTLLQLKETYAGRTESPISISWGSLRSTVAPKMSAYALIPFKWICEGEEWNTLLSFRRQLSGVTCRAS